MNVKDLSIKTKILTGALLLVLITCGFGMLSKLYIGKVSGSLFGITDNNGKAVEYATGVERMALSTIMEEKITCCRRKTKSTSAPNRTSKN